jgi:hypothetical protein
LVSFRGVSWIEFLKQIPPNNSSRGENNGSVINRKPCRDLFPGHRLYSVNLVYPVEGGLWLRVLGFT